ncbi:MAG: AAA family ATPase [Nitrospirae bacterium]|nr:AAA family ATPase [Nitrospirota bacterium]
MYKEHFGLKETPFSIAPDPRYLYMSDGHQEALAHLLYGIKGDGGFILLTGEVGTGKTTVCRCLLEDLPDTVDVAFILNPKLNAVELLASICDELGIRYPKGSKSEKVFIDRINAYLLESHAKGRRTILIIEEAQNLSEDVLEHVRLLTNLETNERKLLQIVMIGQPELLEKLERPELRQLAQRITARYHLGPLTRAEVSAYVSHRLAVAGARGTLFTSSTLDSLFRLTGGIPRLINVVCDRALLGAYVQGQERADGHTLDKAAKEVFGTHGTASRRKMTRRWAVAAAAALLVCAAIASLLLYGGSGRRTPEASGAAADQRHFDTMWWFNDRSSLWQPQDFKEDSGVVAKKKKSPRGRAVSARLRERSSNAAAPSAKQANEVRLGNGASMTFGTRAETQKGAEVSGHADTAPTIQPMPEVK